MLGVGGLKGLGALGLRRAMVGSCGVFRLPACGNRGAGGNSRSKSVGGGYNRGMSKPKSATKSVTKPKRKRQPIPPKPTGWLAYLQDKWAAWGKKR